MDAATCRHPNAPVDSGMPPPVWLGSHMGDRGTQHLDISKINSVVVGSQWAGPFIRALDLSDRFAEFKIVFYRLKTIRPVYSSV
ncbi:hypothetical protein KQX54_012535 [Cotesia glomerata]|uniref:Uncharacterized protein n=1 Tax=Cotesia glomerata TaxID=32391 RepID=A0AAV7IPW3_COTGL|nr:hypothetical protein KQX54_012535 [Cotesia glomerata]